MTNHPQNSQPPPPWTVVGWGALQTAIDLELRQHLLRVHNYMAGALAVSGFAAYMMPYSGFHAFIIQTPFLPFAWLFLLASLGLLALLCFSVEEMSLFLAQVSFWSYAVFLGFSLDCILLVYTGTGIARILLTASATFAMTSFCGCAIRTDPSNPGSLLIVGVGGVMLASGVNVLMSSSPLQLALSAIGAIILLGLTALSNERIKEIYLNNYAAGITGKEALLGALTVYFGATPFLSLAQRGGMLGTEK